MCIGAGISAMAIAEHNCVKGAQEAIEVKGAIFCLNPDPAILQAT